MISRLLASCSIALIAAFLSPNALAQVATDSPEWPESEPSTESAQDPIRARPEPHFADEPVHVEAALGFGTLVGLAGVTVGYNIHDRIELGAGIGLNNLGVIGGAYGRLRPLVGEWRERLHALPVDVGLSMGRYDDTMSTVDMMPSMAEEHEDTSGRYISKSALWLQVEPSWETRSKGGFTLRLGSGLAALLNPSSIECKPASGQTTCKGSIATVIPTFTLGLGHSL